MHPPTPPAEKKTRGVQGEATTSNAHLLVTICSFIVGFVSLVVVIPLHAVVVNFVNDREPDATVRPCTRILGLLLDYLFTTFHGAAYECPCPFAPLLSPLSLSRPLGAGDPCCWGRQHSPPAPTRTWGLWWSARALSERAGVEKSQFGHWSLINY